MTAIAAAVLLAAALALQLKKKAPRAVAVLAALAGIGFAIPLGGWLIGIISTHIAGVAIGLPLTVFLAICFWHEINPKGGKPKRWLTPLVGFVLPALLVANLGGPIGAIVQSAVTTAGNTGGAVVSQVTGNGGGSGGGGSGGASLTSNHGRTGGGR